MSPTQKPEIEFQGIFMAEGSRPPMSRPARLRASSDFIREVATALNFTDDDAARDAADWIADKMERFGALTAQPVFDMNGQGPMCSWCGMIWPLCGHYHQASSLHDYQQADDPAPAPVCPECKTGKHGNCDGRAFDAAADEITACGCTHDEGTKG